MLRFANIFAPAFAALGALFVYEFAIYATKPSPLANAALAEGAIALFQGIAICGGIAAGLAAIAFPLAALARKLPAAYARAGIGLAIGISAIGFLNVIENFTYTITGYGLKNTESVFFKIAFAAAALTAGFAWGRGIGRVAQRAALRAPRLTTAIACLAATAWLPGLLPIGSADDGAASAPPERQLNIVLVSSDGINAESMSVYGATRRTTPFLSEKASEFAIFENSFSNNYGTYGSVASLLTGMSPISTGVVNRPQILPGADAERSLPRLLGQFGYYRSNWGVPKMTSPETVNMLGAFDSDNGSSLTSRVRRLLPRGFDLANWLVVEAADEIGGAVAAVSFQDAMTNAMSEIRIDANRPQKSLDGTRLSGVLADLERSEPVFVHVHFMASHGPKFPLVTPTFSAGRSQTEPWERDFYDDAIRDFDDRVRQVYEHLDSLGKLDETIIVITSDHGMRATLAPRVPLLIRLPPGGLTGRFTKLTQRLDIAPTLLEALGLGVPPWMEGESLLRPASLASDRVLFGTSLAVKPPLRTPGIDRFLDGNHGAAVFYCDKLFAFPGDLLAQALREPFLLPRKILPGRPLPVEDLRLPYPSCRAHAKRDVVRVVQALRARFFDAGRIGNPRAAAAPDPIATP